MKPSNILVDENGSVKLYDFGICGKVDNSVVETNYVGPTQYFAPELITNIGNYDVRSNVWSLGIASYEIATGRSPYQQ